MKWLEGRFSRRSIAQGCSSTTKGWCPRLDVIVQPLPGKSDGPYTVVEKRNICRSALDRCAVNFTDNAD